MTRLNRMFFGKNSPTNVISFNLGDLCEIYVAQKQIREGPDAYYFIVHGLLHAVGYDHKTRREGALMDKKCREYAGIDDCGK
jgi:ssRNA-specific RNase YbeY (16S rRNA maturation enzyme)